MLKSWKSAILVLAIYISCIDAKAPHANDTVVKIIAELQLCDTAIDPDNCIENYGSRILNVKSNNDYSAFIYQTMDGSAQDVPAVKIYLRKVNKNVFVQGIDGFFDTLPGSMTAGFYDIRIMQLSQNDSAQYYESVLYKWDDGKYVEQ